MGDHPGNQASKQACKQAQTNATRTSGASPQLLLLLLLF